jgi:hypothetical protein
VPARMPLNAVEKISDVGLRSSIDIICLVLIRDK